MKRMRLLYGIFIFLLHSTSMAYGYDAYNIANHEGLAYEVAYPSYYECISSTQNVLTNKQAIMNTIYDYTVEDRKGQAVALDTYEGKVLLIVNTATQCGFTPQYEEIEKLYEKYHERGLEILDFPCNQFGGQAPGTDEEINEFCTLNFGTTFPRFKKIDVNGEDASPLYKYLCVQKGFAGWDPTHQLTPILEDMLSKNGPDYKSKPSIKWNFTKFLIDRQGHVVARFEPTKNIDEIAKEIEALL